MRRQALGAAFERLLVLRELAADRGGPSYDPNGPPLDYDKLGELRAYAAERGGPAYTGGARLPLAATCATVPTADGAHCACGNLLTITDWGGRCRQCAWLKHRLNS